MRSQPPRYTLLVVTLLIFMLTGQTGVQGYVWCLGEDGHTALEYAENNSCRTEASPEQDCHADEELAHGDLHRGDHCGPCLDIPASLEAASSRTQKHKSLDSPAGLPAAGKTFPHPARSQLSDGKLLPQPPPRVSQALLAHRTVVLLN